jgi:DNA end-binding protein Ku
VIREAMRRKGVVGIARVVLQRRERILMLEPLGKWLLAVTLRYGYQVRSESAAFEDSADLQVQEDLLDLAVRIIETKTGRFDVTRYEDRYENALLDLVKTKQAGREIQPVRVPQPSNVINLMDALRRSIEVEKAEAAKPQSVGEQPADAAEARPRRRAAVAATARDRVRKSPSKKTK